MESDLVGQRSRRKEVGEVANIGFGAVALDHVIEVCIFLCLWFCVEFLDVTVKVPLAIRGCGAEFFGF